MNNYHGRHASSHPDPEKLRPLGDVGPCPSVKLHKAALGFKIVAKMMCTPPTSLNATLSVVKRAPNVFFSTEYMIAIVSSHRRFYLETYAVLRLNQRPIGVLQMRIRRMPEDTNITRMRS
jgi:hypothetical protein